MDSVTLFNSVKGDDDLNKRMATPPGKNRSVDIHRKAVAKRKKRKKGGHK